MGGSRVVPAWSGFRSEFGNLTVEDDAEGTVDPADLAGTAGPADDGGPDNS